MRAAFDLFILASVVSPHSVVFRSSYIRFPVCPPRGTIRAWITDATEYLTKETLQSYDFGFRDFRSFRGFRETTVS